MPNRSIDRPFFPIIYVRGYAGTQSEVEDTVATPYMGFNLGATKARQRWDGEIVRQVFESPLIRLIKDHGYSDVYRDGATIPEGESIPARSVFIYRYYDPASEELAQGNREEIEAYAEGLSDLVLKVRDQVCREDQNGRASFRVYLVAHSMGGLICRCFLQNPRVGSNEAKSLVDKVFTYATPHNGIDLKVLGNVPGFFTRNNADNFNRSRMIEYLALPPDAERVDSLANSFDEHRVFSLVGTNHRDYEAGGGAVRRAVGEMSDGLVKIANATVQRSPRAFVHRSHSGAYGIVNSEEGYQNLTRFLFGDVRIDGYLEVASIALPPGVQRRKDDGRSVRASYHFEIILRVRGVVWDLHRRTVNENSAVFRTFDQLSGSPEERRLPRLFSTFLRDSARVRRSRRSLGFSADIGIVVPEYEVDGFLFMDDHYEGGYLYRDKINFDLSRRPDGTMRLRYGYDSSTPNRATRDAQEGPDAGTFRVPVRQPSRPGIEAALVLTVSDWNE